MNVPILEINEKLYLVNNEGPRDGFCSVLMVSDSPGTDFNI